MSSYSLASPGVGNRQSSVTKKGREEVMKKGMFLLFVIAALAGCSLSNTSNIVFNASADSSSGAVTTSSVMIASNQYLQSLSPREFNVQLFRIEVMKWAQDPVWTTVFEGDVAGDIVSGLSVGHGSGYSVEAGSYEAVRVTYNPMWSMKVNFSFSNGNYIFDYTNAVDGSTNLTQIVFATANLKDVALKYVDSDHLYNLVAPIEFKGGKTYRLGMVFGTQDMMKVWYEVSGASFSLLSNHVDPLSLSLNLLE